MIDTHASPYLFEAEVLPGLESFAADELRQRHDAQPTKTGPSSGRVPFTYNGRPDELAGLRSITAVYRVLTFDVPRPKALLGHQYFKAITAAAREIVGHDRAFRSISLDAAGSDSSVMRRLKQEIAGATGLQASEDKGDLHLRIRRATDGDGWQALLRLTPRPLVTRTWRLHNFEGALNAAAASVMARLTSPTASDRVLNLACGSGSLMVERAALGSYSRMHGVDIAPDVLKLAQDHLDAAGITDAVLLCADATSAPYRDQSFDVLLADLPFGQRVGSHQDNLRLYPALLREAARLAAPAARFALVTHEKRLMSDVLRRQQNWQEVRRVPFNLNGLHPDIFLLRRA